PVEKNLPRLSRHESAKRVEERRLARAARSEQSDELAGPGDETDLIEQDDGPDLMPEPDGRKSERRRLPEPEEECLLELKQIRPELDEVAGPEPAPLDGPAIDEGPRPAAGVMNRISLGPRFDRGMARRDRGIVENDVVAQFAADRNRGP